MLKLLGAVLVIAASTAGGFYIARSYSDRPKQLRFLQQALQMLRTEIVYGAVPLHLAMKNVADRLPNITRLFFYSMSKNLVELDGASTYECFERAVTKHFYKTSLKNQDKEILIQFGQTLGISDKEDQMRHISLAMQSLAAEETLAREEQKSYEKLSKNLGVPLGLLVVILMY